MPRNPTVLRHKREHDLIINQDILSYCRDYSGDLYHAVLCDPPYNLDSITKRFGKDGSKPAQHGRDGAFSRASKGFMGKAWDSDVAFKPETWEAIGGLMHPGAFGMAFGGARTFYRMMMAMDEAGFIMHPVIFWAYGAGFPKPTNLSKNIDRAAGAEREVIAPSPFKASREAELRTKGRSQSGATSHADITAPATPLAQTWEGHRYGLQALKPAAEPVVVFQKPYEGKPMDCIVRTGAGALNIEGGRVAGAKGSGVWGSNQDNCQSTFNASPGNPDYKTEKNAGGRYPSNVVMSHAPGCRITGYQQDEDYQINRFEDGMKPFGDGAGHPYESETVPGGMIPIWDCADGCPVKALDDQAGVRKSGSMKAHHRVGITGENGKMPNHGVYGLYTARPFQTDTDGSAGGASRFYFQSGWTLETIEADAGLPIAPFYYSTKASNGEKYAGLNLTDDDDFHPTVKPLELVRYLATLLLPPPEYAPRRILNPFAGTGSESIGAMLAGWEHVDAVELGAEYAEFARQRWNFWYPLRNRFIGREIKVTTESQISGQLSLI